MKRLQTYDGGAVLPYEGQDNAALIFTEGMARISIGGDAAEGYLCDARFEGRQPRVEAIGDGIAVTYRRSGPFDWLPGHWIGTEAEVKLRENVRWRIESGGGVWRLSADLRGTRLDGIDIAGGVSDATILLPVPSGLRRVRIGGGASKLRIARPYGTALRLIVEGGVSKLAIDGQRLGAVGGGVELHAGMTPDTADLYEVRICGGASDLVVTTWGPTVADMDQLFEALAEEVWSVQILNVSEE